MNDLKKKAMCWMMTNLCHWIEQEESCTYRKVYLDSYLQMQREAKHQAAR